ncbi:MAG TPA: BlaI/MecI/CopY family transcriptional regulator [Planctomycetaceae bacterium]
MSASPLHVTDAELRVLKLLWEHEPRAAREIAESLYSRLTNSEIGTVQTLLARLEAKGLVSRDRTRHVHQFSTAITSAEFAGRQLAAMVDKLTDGSLAPVLAHLVQSHALSDEDKAELRRLLDETPPPKRRGAR